MLQFLKPCVLLQWKTLTYYSSLFNGEHATTINGMGKNHSLEDILAVAKNIGFKEKQAKEIVLEIKNKCLSLFD